MPGSRVHCLQEITVLVGETCAHGLLHRPLARRARPEETYGAGDSGDFSGITLTKRGRIATWVCYINDRRPTVLTDYDGLDQAAYDGVPARIIALAATELGEQRVL